MELDSSTVQKNLKPRIKIGGVELPDLLVVLIVAAIMDILFGDTVLFIPLVLGLPSLLFLVLYFGKKNKPEGYLTHLFRFSVRKKYYLAADQSEFDEKKRMRIYDHVE